MTPTHRAALKEHLKLAVPNVLSNLTVPLAGLADTVLLGQEKNSLPLAGVALAGAIFSFLYWGFAFLRMSTTGLTSKSVGAEDGEETGALLLRNCGLAVAIGTVMVLLAPVIEEVSFVLLQGSESVEAQGALYFRARIWGAPAVLALMAINGWLLGRLLSRQVLLLSALQNSLIVGLDYLFIWRLGWGAAGAGYATALADGTTFLLALVVVFWSWRDLPPPSLSSVWKGEALKRLLTLNGQIFVRSFFLILTVTSFTNISAWLGDTVVAANAILLQLLLFCAYFVDGYAYALESLAGLAGGRGDWRNVKLQLRIALATSNLTTVFFALVVLLGGQRIFARMTDFENVNALAQSLLPYFALTLVAANFAYIYDGLCTGLTWGTHLRASVIVAALFGFLPLAAVAVFLHSVVWLWIAYLVFSLLRSLYLGWRSETILDSRISEGGP